MDIHVLETEATAVCLKRAPPPITETMEIKDTEGVPWPAAWEGSRGTGNRERTQGKDPSPAQAGSEEASPVQHLPEEKAFPMEQAVCGGVKR